MCIVAWIVPGLGAGLAANMLPSGSRSQGLVRLHVTDVTPRLYCRLTLEPARLRPRIAAASACHGISVL
jgi:hypothetical protein